MPSELFPGINAKYRIAQSAFSPIATISVETTDYYDLRMFTHIPIVDI